MITIRSFDFKKLLSRKSTALPLWLRILDRAVSVFWYLLVISLVLIILRVSTAKLQGRIPDIFGYSIFRITTGSMEPTIPTGSYILVRKAPAKQVQENDIITFYSKNPDIFGMPNTHRVIAPPLTTPLGLCFITRGDATVLTDRQPVFPSDLIGIYCCNLDVLTAVVNFCTTRGMLVILLVLQGLAIIMGSVSVKIIQRRQEKDASAEQPQITIPEEGGKEHERS